jgi:serine/threonine protein kinase
MIDSNILYNHLNDHLYILINKIGSGSYSNVWFSIEIPDFVVSMKRKKINYFPRALKVHLDDSYEQGIMETKINELLSNKYKKSKHINYPLSHFIYDDTNVIVVYELAIGSLYNVLKKFNRKLDLQFLNKIIPQMIEAVKDVHYFDYIHTDIKPENFLLMGLDKNQNDILDFVKNFGLLDKLKRVTSLNKFKSDDVLRFTKQPLLNMIKQLSKKFNLTNNILDSESKSESDSEQDISNNVITIDNKLNSFYSNMSDDYHYEDYDTDVSSYDSRDDEYDNELDFFHTKEIIRHIHLLTNNTNNNVIINNKCEHLLNLMENPIIKLTDFGTIEKKNHINHTLQTRYYRAVEVILGFDFDKSIDIWSLGCSIYELVTGKILVYTCKDKDKSKYDTDLINIKIIAEKMTNYERNNLINFIKSSNRKMYLLNNKDYLKFFDNIKYNCWKNDLYEIYKDNYCELTNVEKIIDNMLKINPNERTF